MNRMGLLITPELCIGCRACQTACKVWNRLPGIKTRNLGSFENPPDLSAFQFNRIRYIELPSVSGSLRWLFVSRRCMHCGDAGCMKICPASGALYRTAGGAVAYDREKCIGCRLCVLGCPFEVPRYDSGNKIAKCHLCSDRTPSALHPACASVCPTGAIRFGERSALMKLSRERGYEKLYGERDLGGLGALYALRDPPQLYGMIEEPAIPAHVTFWHSVIRPVSLLGLGGAILASLFHYFIFGPGRESKEGAAIDTEGCAKEEEAAHD